MGQRVERSREREVVPVAILAVIVAYVAALCVGWPQLGTQQIVAQQAHSFEKSAQGEANDLSAPPVWTVVPFVLLLAGIAVLPLIPATSKWWESNLNRFKVAGGLALVTMAYYAFLHSSERGIQTGLVNTILANAMLQEF